MNAKQSHWIVPFKGRNHSGATKQNFLWRSDKLYVMDNHRAAMWCWLQEIDPKKPHSLMHIDRHYDALSANLDCTITACPPWDCCIDEYLGSKITINGFDCPTIRWDNYLSIYLHEFGSSLMASRLLTHRDGDIPAIPGQIFESELWELPENMEYWLECGPKPWIVNIDLDYFYCDFDADDAPKLMVSDDYIVSVSKALKSAMDSGSIGVVTLCLTPDKSFTAGWDETEKLASKICSILGYDFKLP